MFPLAKQRDSTDAYPVHTKDRTDDAEALMHGSRSLAIPSLTLGGCFFGQHAVHLALNRVQREVIAPIADPVWIASINSSRQYVLCSGARNFIDLYVEQLRAPR